MAKPALIKEYEYYMTHHDELVEKYLGRIVVIKDGELLGAYSSEADAVEGTLAEHELGTFLVRQVKKDEDGTTQLFHSRVDFA